MKNLYRIFFLLTAVSLILFLLVWIKDSQFKNNPLPPKTIQEIKIKESQIRSLIYQYYNINVHFPIIIEDTLPNNLFGLASYKNGDIRIYLNKKRFQESENYMIDHVLPHEYAHGVMFYFGKFTTQNGGHTKFWQEICRNIGGKKCNRFVDHNDILIEKLGGIY